VISNKVRPKPIWVYVAARAIAAAALFLASSESSFVTGTDLTVGGGISVL
jgi:NAD(P)-dependent dehydrogenase (short-subunit alcohol dehydrogenase family)